MKYLTLSFVLVVAASCKQPSKQPASQTEAVETPLEEHHSPTVQKIFEAHGGYANWSKMASLSYLKGKESTVTNLKNRKIRLDSEDRTIGFDGQEVWVYPDTIDASRARFYHNLYFYFYAMPFVVGDPGVFYEDVAPQNLLGETLNGVKISYGADIGDSPKDNYIVWYDPQTYRMRWLMYTVTYSSGTTSDTYKLIRYDDWGEVSGLMLPTSFTWYGYKDGTIGDAGRKALFTDIRLSDLAPDEALFARPEGSQIAPL